MKKVIITFLFLVFSTFLFSQSSWKVDTKHSSVIFKIKHSGISFVTGNFNTFDGTLTSSKEDFSDAQFNFTIDVSSIDTGVEGRDNHLKNADFFEVEKYPNITFVSKKIVATDDKNEFLLTGDLTIKDVTKEVTFELEFGGTVKNERGEKVGLEAETTINRLEFNINYDPTGKGLGSNVQIEVNAQFAKK